MNKIKFLKFLNFLSIYVNSAGVIYNSYWIGNNFYTNDLGYHNLIYVFLIIFIIKLTLKDISRLIETSSNYELNNKCHILFQFITVISFLIGYFNITNMWILFIFVLFYIIFASKLINKINRLLEEHEKN